MLYPQDKNILTYVLTGTPNKGDPNMKTLKSLHKSGIIRTRDKGKLADILIVCENDYSPVKIHNYKSKNKIVIKLEDIDKFKHDYPEYFI